MQKPYRIQVFGKTDCDKCKTLNQRIDRLLKKDAWAAFDKQSVDLMTVEGLVPFCEAECINPQQIPAMLVRRLNPETGDYDMIAAPQPITSDDVCGASRLFHVIGLQTDYASGGGVITPAMIKAVLAEAQTLAPVDEPAAQSAEAAAA